MNCNKIHKNLIFFLEGELPTEEMQAIEAHLVECPTCASFADDMNRTLGILNQEKTPKLNPFFYTRVNARLEQSQQIPITKPIFIRLVQPVAFSLLLLAGIYTGFKLGDTSTLQNTAMVTEQEMIPYWNALDGEPIENFLMQ